jgi:hypothetical protein
MLLHRPFMFISMILIDIVGASGILVWTSCLLIKCFFKSKAYFIKNKKGGDTNGRVYLMRKSRKYRVLTSMLILSMVRSSSASAAYNDGSSNTFYRQQDEKRHGRMPCHQTNV